MTGACRTPHKLLPSRTRLPNLLSPNGPGYQRPVPGTQRRPIYPGWMPVVERIGVIQIRDIVVVFRDLLRSHQATINRLNVYPVPDGDTGTNMARTLDAVVAELDGARADLGAVTKAMTH